MLKTSSPLRLVILLIGIWGLLVIRLGAPWYGVQEAARIWVHAGVKNYDRYGLDETNWMVVRDLGPASPPDYSYYVHHPPTVIWLPYAMTRFTGDNELSIRFVFAAATLLAASAFYVLVRRLYGVRIAWWATAFYGLVPMMSYYGRVPNHDPLTMPVVMLFAAILVNWLRSPNRWRLLALGLLVWMAVWTAWTGVFFVAFLGLAAMLLGRMEHKIAVVGFGVICIVAFVALIVFYQSQWDGAIDSLVEVFGWRSSNLSDDRASEPFTIFQFVAVTLVHIGLFVTVGVTVMSLWGIQALRRISSRQATGIVLALLGGALIYQLVFRNASYVHDYYKLTFVPVMAISAAAAWVTLRKRHRWTRPIFDALLVISVLMGAAWLFWLHASGDRPTMTAIIEVIEAETTTDDTVMTNMTGRDLVWPLAFYGFRNIQENKTYEDARAQADTTDARVMYILCDAAGQGVDSAIPDASADDTIERITAESCEIALFR